MRTPYISEQRPNPPRGWQRTIITKDDAIHWNLVPPEAQLQSYDTTWHHNIAWELLRDSWNIICTIGSKEVIKNVLNLYSGGRYTTEQDSLIDGVMAFRNAFGPQHDWHITYKEHAKLMRSEIGRGHLALGADPAELSVNSKEILLEIIAWQPWNIVEGVLNTVRTDDPGEAYDDFSRVHTLNFSHLVKVKAYGECLNWLCNQYAGIWTSCSGCEPNLHTSLMKTLKDAIDKALSFRSQGVTRFSKEHWELTSKMKYNTPIRINTVPCYRMKKRCIG